MLFTNAFALLAMTGLVSAAPSKVEPRILTHDDVILPRKDGGFDVMKKWEWSDIERRLEKEMRDAATEAKRRSLAGETIPVDAKLKRDEDGVQRRACEQSSELQLLDDMTFTDWDYAMSPVIGATGGQATVAVTKGYSVSNTITVGVSAEYTFIKDVLSASIKTDYSYAWTTTDSQTFTYWVNPGQYGVVVSNPYTRRLVGNYISGCTDSPTYDYFQADSRSSETFGELAWVSGPISLCNSSSYPVPYCVGEGTHT